MAGMIGCTRDWKDCEPAHSSSESNTSRELILGVEYFIYVSKRSPVERTV